MREKDHGKKAITGGKVSIDGMGPRDHYLRPPRKRSMGVRRRAMYNITADNKNVRKAWVEYRQTDSDG